MRTIYRALASIIGAVLSVSGCSDGKLMEPDYGAAEYGMPTAQYSLSGRVLDADDGSGVAGIEVAFHVGLIDTTDAEGRWSFEGSRGYAGDQAALELRDIDGDENGNYLGTQALVDLDQTLPGDGDWDRGRYEAHDVDIELSEADDD